MSGFDPSWLALREPVDHASRHAGLAAQLREHFAARASLVVVDLGCGTGSNLRALADLLPPRQHWHLIDGDAELLAAARERLSDWADSANPTTAGLELQKDGRQIAVSFECADLTVRDLDFADLGCGLVTAAALFDLVSREWLEKLVVASARSRAPLYSVLNYDGVAEWSPGDPLDARVLTAFNRHQRGDKSFGPALGPTASDTLVELLTKHGYSAASSDSPWELTEQNAALIARVTEGFAQAATEIEPEARVAFAHWAAAQATAAKAMVGHKDVFATA